MTEIYKSTISYLSWEAYTDKPEWILELFEQELLFEDENGKILIKADGDQVALKSGNKVVSIGFFDVINHFSKSVNK